MKRNKTLDKLKAKRAKYAAGGYGYTDGSRTKADSQPSGDYTAPEYEEVDSGTPGSVDTTGDTDTSSSSDDPYPTPVNPSSPTLVSIISTQL